MAKVLPALYGSREQNKERTFLVCVGLVVLCGWLWVPTAADVRPKELFLNKPRDCGHGDSKVPWYRVKPESLYNIKDTSPHTRTKDFLECTMVFGSPNKDGRLCVFQHKLEFLTDGMELRLYDKYVNVTDQKMKATKVMNDETGLKEVEWCTSGQFLTLEMGQRKVIGSVQDVEIDLLIYHISNNHRKAYMDTTPFCDSRYQMDNSRVRVTSTELGKSEERIHPKCSLHFDYSGQETRNLCLIFDPLPSPGADNTAQCKFNYTLHVYEQGSSEPAFNLGGCGEQVQRRWCSNSTTNTTDITLMLDRHFRGVEDGILFKVLVMDHHGDASTLHMLSTANSETDRASETNTASTNDHTMIMMVACLGVILVSC